MLAHLCLLSALWESRTAAVDLCIRLQIGAALAYEPGADSAALRVRYSPALEVGDAPDAGRLRVGLNQELTAVMVQARAVADGQLDAAHATTGFVRHSAGLGVDRPLGDGVTLHAWGGYILQEGWGRWDPVRQQLDYAVHQGQGGLVGHVEVVAGEKHTGVAVGVNAVQEPQRWGVLRYNGGPRALQAEVYGEGRLAGLTARAAYNTRTGTLSITTGLAF